MQKAAVIESQTPLLLARLAQCVPKQLNFCAAAFRDGKQFVHLPFCKPKSGQPGSNALNFGLSLIPFQYLEPRRPSEIHRPSQTTAAA